MEADYHLGDLCGPLFGTAPFLRISSRRISEAILSEWLAGHSSSFALTMSLEGMV
jgi:hypothetical protein